MTISKKPSKKTLVKNPSKKRKRVKVVDGKSLNTKIKPLGIEEYPDVEKTAEELELEEAVFGFAPPQAKLKQEQQFNSEKQTLDEKSARSKLAGLEDHQLFVLDEPHQPKGSSHLDDLQESTHKPDSKLGKKTQKSKQPTEKAPVWKDGSANQVLVSLTDGPSRRKKLRTLDDLDTGGEIKITGEEYEKRLRLQYEKIHPLPSWLKDRQEPKINEAVVAAGDEDDDQFLGLDLILKSTGDLNSKIISKNNGHSVLPKGRLEVTRLRDANQAEPENTQSPISCLQFHPQSDILLTGSTQSKRLSFFKIDGTHNPALHFVHTPDLPIQAAQFCPPSSTNTSSTVLITGHRPYFYTFDLRTCQCIKSPQSLFHKSVFSQSSKGTSLSHFKFSPQGNLVAFVGRNGLIELVDWSNNIGSSQILHSLKSNTPIKSLAWDRNGTELLTIGNNAEVSIWDLRMNRILGSWFDDGGFNPTIITTTDQDSRLTTDGFTAIGSQTGIVNLYSSDQVNPPDNFQSKRKAFKTIENLTTSIHRLKFNPDAQILGISSQAKRDAFKLVHVQSGTVFSNWPTANTPLGHVTDLDFNYKSNYFATSNNRGKVLLYSLKFWE